MIYTSLFAVENQFAMGRKVAKTLSSESLSPQLKIHSFSDRKHTFAVIGCRGCYAEWVIVVHVKTGLLAFATANRRRVYVVPSSPEKYDC